MLKRTVRRNNSVRRARSKCPYPFLSKNESMFCAAVKHAKRLSKRMNSKQKSTDESEDDEDDMVRIITDKSASSPLQSH